MINHPVDPASKYLYHSFVESPEMKNVYDGTVILDREGRATVAMPDWFEALNRDLRGDTKNHQRRQVTFPDIRRTRLDDHLTTRIGQESDALVLKGPDGGALSHSNFRDRFWSWQSRMRSQSAQYPCLRHTFASLAANAGASVKLVQINWVIRPQH
jgi:hypothetical protein